MRVNKTIVGTCVAVVLTIGLAVGSLHIGAFAQSGQTAGTVSVAVGPHLRHHTCPRCTGRF